MYQHLIHQLTFDRKAWTREYSKRDYVRERKRLSDRRYRQTERGREAHRRSNNKYNNSIRGRESKKKWAHSPNGKEYKRNYGGMYRMSQHGKEIIKRYFSLEDVVKKVRERGLKYSRSEEGRCKSFIYRQSQRWKEINRMAVKKYAKTDKGKLDRKRYRERVKLKVVDILGNKCNHCGYTDIRALEIDHINGGGKLARRLFGGELKEWLYFLKVPDELIQRFQILCRNCHKLKTIEDKKKEKLCVHG